jgi:hypothetical protein
MRYLEAIEYKIFTHNFEGVSVHDGLASYGKYHSTHALGNTHHLRELQFIFERYERDWASEMMTLLVEIETTVGVAQAVGETRLTFTQIADFEHGVSTVEFVNHLQKQYLGKKIILIWDGASYHRFGEFRDYLERINQGISPDKWMITCVLFAPNAPQQNPLEDV